MTDKKREIKTEYYLLNSDVLEYLPTLNFDLQSFKSLTGNSLQHYLHSETVSILNETAALLGANPDFYQSQILSHLTFFLNDLAKNYNGINQIQKTFAANNASRSIFEMSKKLFYYLNKNKGDLILGAAEGIPSGIYDSVNSAYQTVRHPIDTFNSFTDVASNLWHLYKLSKENPDEFDKKYHVFLEAFQQQFEEFEKLVETNPRAVAKEASRLLTSIIVGNKIPTLDGAVINNFGKICNGIKTEAKIISKNVIPELNSLLTPLHSIRTELKSVQQLASKYGYESIEYAKKCLCAYPGAHGIGYSTAELLDLLAKNKDILDGKGLIHILRGEFLIIKKDGKELFRLKSGMHTKEAFNDFKKAANLADNMYKTEKSLNGIVIVILPESAFVNKKQYDNAYAIINGKKCYGVKTLWPEHYTPHDILDATKEVILNPSNKINSGIFIGITSKGIKVKVRLNQDGNLITSFPLLN